MFNSVYKDKTVLVTGDTGFKGSWLAIWLKELGANVIGYSLNPGTEEDNYVVCGLAEKITHIDGDIREQHSLKSVFDKYKPDIIFHLAAQSLVLESYNDPVETYSTNVMGTVNILEVIRYIDSVKVAVIITTDKCYENRESEYRYRETDRLGGKDHYSASKAACEIVINSYIQSFFNHDSTASVASARAGNIIGGGDWAENRIIPDCIRSLRRNEPIIVRNPQAVRPWQYILEPLSGYLKLGACLYKDGKEYSGAWNFGPKDTITVKGLVDEVIDKWGQGELSISAQSNQNLEANLLYLDISKALDELEWDPKLNIAESVKYTIDQYKVANMSRDEVFQQRVKYINDYCKI